mgnify:CR=1 FL=1
MATLTAGNFYWAGYKPLGSNPFWRYERGTTWFGNTGYSWSEVGNWFIRKEGYTGDRSGEEGGYTQDYYFEDAPRVTYEGDSINFTQLYPWMPGIDGYYPVSECLFGGLTGPRDGDGGTWLNSNGTNAEKVGYLAEVIVEKDYAQNRGASFALGNEFGATFGQHFKGLSASIVIGGLTGLSGATGTIIFENTDGTKVTFAGNTAYNWYESLWLGNTADAYGRTGYWVIGTNGFTWGQGKTFATRALYSAFVAAVTGEKNQYGTPIGEPWLNMELTHSWGNTVGTTFGVEQQQQGLPGNTDITGTIVGFRVDGGTATSTHNSLVGYLGITGTWLDGITYRGTSMAFTGGTDNPTENPLSIKSESVILFGDNPTHFVDSKISRQAFIQSKGQFNYKRGSIRQLLYDREEIDYLGPPRTASFIEDTELTNSVKISGGTYQSLTRRVFNNDQEDEAGTIVTTPDVGGSRPVTYIRASGGIPNFTVDAFRCGRVTIDGAVTTLDVSPEKIHASGPNYQGLIDIRRPMSFPDLMDYNEVSMNAFNSAEGIAGTTGNTRLMLNAGLTIHNLNLDSGTMWVGPAIGDRAIEVVQGRVQKNGYLLARSQYNPSYQGFRIGVTCQQAGSSAGLLVYHPDARIEFSTGHYVLASFSFGSTGADTAFKNPNPPTPIKPPA